MIGYRRLGHNEIDTPEFTQPLMYKEIKERKNIYNLYKDELIQEGLLTQAEADQRFKSFMDHYKEDADLAMDENLLYHEEFEQITEHWKGMDPKINSPAMWTGKDKAEID